MGGEGRRRSDCEESEGGRGTVRGCLFGREHGAWGRRGWCGEFIQMVSR